MKHGRDIFALVTVAVVWTAGVIHLVLIPEHFGERFVYGVFFLAAAFQLALGRLLLRRPASWVVQAGALGSLALLAAWLGPRAVVPPLAPHGRPEPVTTLGVVSTAALVLLVSRLSLPEGRTRSAARWWGTAAALAYAALFLLASNAVSYAPGPGPAPSLRLASAGGFTLTSPLIYGRVQPHVRLVAPWATLAFLAEEAFLLGVNVAAVVRRTTCARDAARAPATLVVASSRTYLSRPGARWPRASC